MLVIRHRAPGSAAFLAGVLDCPVINAGDGPHEHPTQALLDLFTMTFFAKRLLLQKGLC